MSRGPGGVGKHSKQRSLQSWEVAPVFRAALEKMAFERSNQPIFSNFSDNSEHPNHLDADLSGGYL
jgi:hypothetical protein